MRAIAAGLSSGQPEAAVGAEGLLRGEVVGVGLGDVDRQAAGARGGVDQDQRVAGAVGAARPSTITPVEVSLWAQAIDVGGGVGDRRRARRRARPRPRSGRRGTARRRSPWRTSRELAVGQVQGALAHQPGGGGVPEGGRAAVAERDLVAVGQREELAEARRGRGATRSRTGAWRCEVPISSRALGQRRQRLRAHLRGPAAEAAVGGLQLGRDLRGVGAAGVIGLDRLLTVAGGLAPGPRVGSPRCRPQSRPTRRENRCTRSATKPISTRRRTAGRPSSGCSWRSRGSSSPPSGGSSSTSPTSSPGSPWSILGRYPQWLYDFNSGVVRFTIRIIGLGLPADRRRGRPFGLSDDPSYPIRVNFAAARPSARAGSRPSSASSSALPVVLVLSYGTTYITQLVAVVAWLTIVFRGYLPEGINNMLTFVQQLPRPGPRLPGDPHRRLPADRPRAGQAGAAAAPAPAPPAAAARPRRRRSRRPR